MTGNGKGAFKAQMPYESGLIIRGEVRKVEEIKLAISLYCKNKRIIQIQNNYSIV